MYEYIKGEIQHVTPTYVTIDNNGVGYFLNISLHTYAKLKEGVTQKLLIHEIIREDAYELFGFFDEQERFVFKSLITVLGVGANTARMMLSSLSPDEVIQAIANGDVRTLKAVKGIGEKSAQRIIIDLKDKIGKPSDSAIIFSAKDNTIRQEALSALVMLGFSKNMVDKVLDKVLAENPSYSVEQLVKMSLKTM